MPNEVYSPGPPRGTPVGAPEAPPPGPTSPTGRTGRAGSNRWLVVLIVVLVLLVLGTMARLSQLERRVDDLSMNQGAEMSNGSFFDGSAVDPPAPPVDLPPMDADVARRSIVAAHEAVFTGATAEERVAQVVDPGDLLDRFTSLAGSSCRDIRVVVTEIRFVDDDVAAVTFRFEGPGVPDGGQGIEFSTVARRGETSWRVDGGGVREVLDLASPYCS